MSSDTTGHDQVGAVFQHLFADQLPGLCREDRPRPAPTPRLVAFNTELAELLGLDEFAALAGGNLDARTRVANVFSGNSLPAASRPIAQAYAGHQFGSYSPILGDGRALMVGELAPDGGVVEVALKGSGPTPFARNGDGRAGIGPVLREYLISEAMHALGVPTTRALAAVTTGDVVRRQHLEPAAVLTRVATSHLRVGTFEYAARTGVRDQLAALTRFALARHLPDLPTPKRDAEAATVLLQHVVERQAELVAQWMHLGFIHGVMNTDNMTISGETIDYGPCAFMEAFDPDAVFSSIDHHGRYRYRHQPTIALWNLARLAESLLGLIVEGSDDRAVQAAIDSATTILDDFEPRYDGAWLRLARQRLGTPDAPRDLADQWLALLQRRQADVTLAWRSLAAAAGGDPAPLDAIVGDDQEGKQWVRRWTAERSTSSNAVASMKAHSPIYVPRNHLVEQALAGARQHDYSAFEALLTAVRAPFVERTDWARFAEPADEAFTANFVTFCGT